jgi:Zn-dependent alcohol dehydrogenase
MGANARVVVLPREDRPLYIEEVELASPGPHEVIVRQFASGICHTQLGQMQTPRTGPVVLGHESTGVVLSVGSSVTAVTTGQRVIVTWIPCRPLEGRTVGPTTIELGDGTVASSLSVFTWADHTICDEAYVVPLPQDAPTDVTSVVGCAVMTGAGAVLRTAGVRPGESVAVFGVGGVGLTAVGAAAIIGADPVIAVDIDPAKLAFATRFGATDVIDATSVDAVAAIRELTNARQTRPSGRSTGGVDYAFDCVGASETMRQVLAAARPGMFGVTRGGTAVLVGIPERGFELDALDLLRGEKTYRGSVAGSCLPDRDFPIFLRWHEQKRLDLEVLVTRRYPMTEINEATAALRRGEVLGRAILEFEQ